MSQTFRDYIPEGEDNGAYKTGTFKDWVPEGEALPEGMSGAGLDLKSADELAKMKMGAIVEYAHSIGLADIEHKPGMKKADLVSEIVERQAGNPAAAEEATEEEVEEEETESEEETEGETAVPGLDEEVSS